MTNKTREQLMCVITESSFAIDDVKLYLDTHPCDKEALEYYQNYRKIRKEAIKEYRDCYGPISSYDVAEANVWTWIDEPWPWEGVC
jgi:spore coat protein JB